MIFNQNPIFPEYFKYTDQPFRYQMLLFDLNIQEGNVSGHPPIKIFPIASNIYDDIVIVIATVFWAEKSQLFWIMHVYKKSSYPFLIFVVFILQNMNFRAKIPKSHWTHVLFTKYFSSKSLVMIFNCWYNPKPFFRFFPHEFPKILVKAIE